MKKKSLHIYSVFGRIICDSLSKTVGGDIGNLTRLHPPLKFPPNGIITEQIGI